MIQNIVFEKIEQRTGKKALASNRKHTETVGAKTLCVSDKQ
jgi:hypothetical protein